ncbi:MAG: 30S ribosomal protein S27ae [Acidilobaceae archaeon]
MAKKELKTYIHKVYIIDVEKGSIRLKNKKCPRCGSIMAHHMQPVERWHCGKCSYTEFITKPVAPALPKKIAKREEKAEEKDKRKKT